MRQLEILGVTQWRIVPVKCRKAFFLQRLEHGGDPFGTLGMAGQIYVLEAIGMAVEAGGQFEPSLNG